MMFAARATRPHRSVLSAIALVMAASVVSAVDDPTVSPHFERLDQVHGRLNERIITIKQAPEGPMWVGTESGLMLVAGAEVRRFLARPEEPQGLSSTLVSAIEFDPDGRIIVGTEGGGLNLRGTDGQGFLSYRHDPVRPDSLPSDRVYALLSEPGTGVWVGTAAGLALLRNTSMDEFELAAPVDEQVAVFSLALDRAGTLWAGTHAGLYEVDTRAMTITRFTRGQAAQIDTEVWSIIANQGDRLWMAVPGMGVAGVRPADGSVFWMRANEGEHSLSTNEVYRVLFDQDNSLWVGTYQGLHRLNGLTGTVDWFRPDLNDRGALSHRYIYDLFEDHEGTLWIGTYGGGLNLLRKNWQQLQYRGRKITGGDDITAIAEAGDGSLWTSVYEGTIAHSRDGKSLNKIVDLPFSRAWSFHEINTERWLVGASEGLFEMQIVDGSATFTRLLEGDIWSVVEDDVGTIWAGDFGGGVYRFDDDLSPVTVELPEYIEGSEIAQILRAPDGGVLLVTFWEGVWRFTDEAGFEPVPIASELLLMSPINTVAAHHSVLWLGLRGQGLLRVDGDEVSHWGQADGLPDANINALLIDPSGRVWVGTDSGLARIDESGNAERLRGLPDARITAIQRLRDGRLAIGTERGLFTAADDYFVAGTPPRVVITAVEVGHQAVAVALHRDAHLQLDYDQSEVKVAFAALEYLDHHLVRYRYRLTGHDTRWIAPSRGVREAQYTSLNPGEYSFQVQAQVPGQPWQGQQASLTFSVPVAPWLRPWAWLLYAIALGLLIWWQYRAQSARRAAETRELLAVRESRSQIRLALWASGETMWRWSRDLGAVYASSENSASVTATTSVWTLGQLIRFAPRARRSEMISVMRSLLAEDAFQAQFMVEPSGQPQWWRVRGRVLERDVNGRPSLVTGTGKNITERIEAQNRLRLAARIIENSEEAVVIMTADGVVEQVNHAFVEFTGFSADEILGQSITVLDSSHGEMDWADGIRSEIERHGEWEGQMWQRRQSGELFLSQLKVAMVHAEPGEPSRMVGIFADITRRQQVEQDLRYLAKYDSQTALPNRTLFEEQLDYAIGLARRDNEPLAVALVGIDALREMHDALGATNADLILRETAARLSDQGALVARLSEDEFGVVLDERTDRRGLDRRLTNLLEKLQAPIEGASEVTQVVARIGVTVFPEHGVDVDDLIRNAHQALSFARSALKPVQFFDASVSKMRRSRMMMETALRRAVSDGELGLAYQPKIDVLRQQVTGVEALLRWSHDGVSVSPEVFVALAEERGMIVEIGEWVLKQAMQDVNMLRSSCAPELQLSVNVSAHQLQQRGFAQLVARLLSELSFEPSALQLEITESAIINDAARSVRVMQGLKELGVELVLDDFGTGYSSLSYVNRFPIDRLKIDKSFVTNLETDRPARAIVTAMVSMAGALGIDITAEGVERAGQLKLLRGMGVREIQGFHFATPLPMMELTKFLQDWQSDQAQAAAGAHTETGSAA